MPPRKTYPTRLCAYCEQPFTPATGGHRMCSAACRNEAAATKLVHLPQQKRDLTLAVESGDAERVFDAIRQHCEIVGTCWVWSRPPKRYPRVTLSGRSMAVHRIALEAKLGRSLGAMCAHHKCANNRCVNPDHLQEATANANAAEMHERHAYRRRIRELEECVAKLEGELAELRTVVATGEFAGPSTAMQVDSPIVGARPAPLHLLADPASSVAS